MSQTQSLACSVYFYFPASRASPSSLSLCVLGASPRAPAQGGGAGRTRRCSRRSRSSKGSFVPASKGRAASSAPILTITLPGLKSRCARRCGPWSLSPDIHFLFLVSPFSIKKVKINTSFFTWKATLMEKSKHLLLPTAGWNFWLLLPL